MAFDDNGVLWRYSNSSPTNIPRGYDPALQTDTALANYSSGGGRGGIVFTPDFTRMIFLRGSGNTVVVYNVAAQAVEDQFGISCCNRHGFAVLTPF